VATHHILTLRWVATNDGVEKLAVLLHRNLQLNQVDDQER